MRYLAHRKITIAEKIGSSALRADVMEALTCGWLSFVVVVSLAAQCLVGAWWIDGVRSMAIAYFLIRKAARRGPAANAAVANRSRHYKTRYKTLTLRLKCINDFNM
jgi:divalent metal cation (Fe/Co/Zn/Cd) transporter